MSAWVGPIMGEKTKMMCASEVWDVTMCLMWRWALIGSVVQGHWVHVLVKNVKFHVYHTQIFSNNIRCNSSSCTHTHPELQTIC